MYLRNVMVHKVSGLAGLLAGVGVETVESLV